MAHLDYVPGPGDHIRWSVHEALHQAQINKRDVHFIHANILCIVKPDSNPDEVLAEWKRRDNEQFEIKWGHPKAPPKHDWYFKVHPLDTTYNPR